MGVAIRKTRRGPDRSPHAQILASAVKGALFPDTDPNTATWADPPPDVVAVRIQFLPCASPAISLSAAFLAMLSTDNLKAIDRIGTLWRRPSRSFIFTTLSCSCPYQSLLPSPRTIVGCGARSNTSIRSPRSLITSPAGTAPPLPEDSFHTIITRGVPSGFRHAKFHRRMPPDLTRCRDWPCSDF